MDAAIAAVLNAEGFLTAKGTPFRGELVHLLRKRWGIATVKINGTSPNPDRWPDGTYSVQGVAKAVGITTQVVFDWLKAGLLTGAQSAKGQPWQITMSDETLDELRARVKRTKRSRGRQYETLGSPSSRPH